MTVAIETAFCDKNKFFFPPELSVTINTFKVFMCLKLMGLH